MLSWMKKKKKQNEDLIVMAPLNGRAVPLEKVPDAAFAEGMMGKGIAIEPTEGKVFSPFNGLVAHFIKTKHAIVLEHDSGAQVLIHVGMDTVSLKGEGFTPMVETGDRVSAGQILLEFDMEHIKAAGYPIITPVIVPNGLDAVLEVKTHEGEVSAGQNSVITIKLA
ncbi:PTS sugar transporter subunit IIA [Paenibacillus massiliensis]|uniref:PTS sugar transporter subunit IIA n=1 Tax=Paenibacillus massiliensis TaxID=225917 RepID=UPI00049175BC|nr:PTS glucose transporter subunit IIA [Paenibacillus massiliensis]